jgi:hypothetical protein
MDGLDGMVGGTDGVDGLVRVAVDSGAALTIGLSAVRTDGAPTALTAFTIGTVPAPSFSVTPTTRADMPASPAVATTITLPLLWAAGARWAPT